MDICAHAAITLFAGGTQARKHVQQIVQKF